MSSNQSSGGILSDAANAIQSTGAAVMDSVNAAAGTQKKEMGKKEIEHGSAGQKVDGISDLVGGKKDELKNQSKQEGHEREASFQNPLSNVLPEKST